MFLFSGDKKLFFGMVLRGGKAPARRIRRAIREPPGWRLASLAEGRGLSVITVCGYRRETRV